MGVKSFPEYIFNMTFLIPSTFEVDVLSMYKCSSSISLWVENTIFLAHTFLIALVLIHYYSRLLIRLTLKTITNKFFFETSFMTWLTSVTLAWVMLFFFVGFSLLSLISTILGLMSNLIAGEVFVIKFLSNPLYLYNKLLLLVLLWVFTFYSTMFALETILEELALLLDNLLSLSIINLKIRSSTLIFIHLCLR